MTFLSRAKRVVPTSLLALMLALSILSSAAVAREVIISHGTVEVARNGTVFVAGVCVDQDCLRFIASNGRGLLRARKIKPGQTVSVRVAYDKRHKHRGHVTILK